MIYTLLWFTYIYNHITIKKYKTCEIDSIRHVFSNMFHAAFTYHMHHILVDDVIVSGYVCYCFH